MGARPAARASQSGAGRPPARAGGQRVSARMLQLGDLLQVRWDCIHVATRGEARALREQLRAEGVRVFAVPGGRVRTERRLLQLLKRKLRLPDYFAENWISLQYCLRQLEETQPTTKGYVMFLQDADALWNGRRTIAWKLLRAWRTAAPTWRERGLPFHLVFVNASGDEWADLPDEPDAEPAPDGE